MYICVCIYICVCVCVYVCVCVCAYLLAFVFHPILLAPPIRRVIDDFKEAI